MTSPVGQFGESERIAQFASRGAAGVDPLLAMLTEVNWSTRREVVTALAALGDHAAAPMCALLASARDDEARIAALVDALAICAGDEVETQILRLADGAGAQVLADVAQILGRRRSARGTATLIVLTEHADDNVAVGAIEALGRVGGRAAVDALIRCVRSDNFFRVFPATDVLGRSGDPRAVEPLAALLSDPRYALEAARALGRTAARSAVKPLAQLLAAPALGLVRVAALALHELVERHRDLYGSTHTLTSSLQTALSGAHVRRLIQSLTSADAAEKLAVGALLAYTQHEAATAVLLELLDGEPELARTAGQALMRSGRATQREFFASLVNADSQRRKKLLPLVVAQGNTDAIMLCLRDESPDVRVLACESLSRLGASAAVPALFELLDDPNQRVVYAAVAALNSLGTADTEELALAAAQSARPGARRAAMRVLAYFGYESALPLFVAANGEHDDPRIRDIALQGLALIDHPDAVTALVSACGAPDAGARAAAVRALGHARFDDRVAACLEKCVADQNAWVRYYACQALGKLRVRTADQQLDRLLGDSAGQVRVAAIEALAQLGTDLAHAALRRACADDDVDLRRAALLGLGIARDVASIPVLVRAALGDDPATQLVALSSLAVLDHADVVPTLLEAAKSPSETVRQSAVTLLAEHPRRAAADALVELLLRDGPREDIREALSRARSGLVEALQAALASVDDARAAWLTASLSRLQSEAADTALLETLASPNVAARKVAVSAVAALGTSGAQRALELVATQDPDVEVRRVASLYLST